MAIQCVARVGAVLLLAGAAFLASARPLPALNWEDLRLTGYVETDNRFTTQEKSRFTFNENTLKTELRAFPVERAELVATARFKAIGLDERTDDKNLISIYEQQDSREVDPLTVILDEAYLMVHGLGTENLDLKLGKQLIIWGTGDQFNPTNNLNPYDIHDPLLFGKKVPTAALLANYYLGPLTLTGVILPLFQPALLPLADIRSVFEAQFVKMTSRFQIRTGNPALDTLFAAMMASAVPQAKLGSIEIESELPEKLVRNAGFALKVAGKLGDVDLSASYAHVWDDFGVPRRVTIGVDPFAGGSTKLVDTVDINVRQEFPRYHIAGADFATNIPGIDVGAWGEFAVFFPNEIRTEYFVDAGPALNQLLSLLAGQDCREGLKISEEVATRDPYVKAVAGLDYTFPEALYCNIQYVRGLPNDNTADLLADYVFAGFDKPFLHDRIKPRVFGGYCFEDSSSIIYPQLFYYPMDSLEFHVGELFVFGEPDTKFGAFGDDTFFLRARLSF